MADASQLSSHLFVYQSVAAARKERLAAATAPTHQQLANYPAIVVREYH